MSADPGDGDPGDTGAVPTRLSFSNAKSKFSTEGGEGEGEGERESR